MPPLGFAKGGHKLFKGGGGGGGGGNAPPLRVAVKYPV